MELKKIIFTLVLIAVIVSAVVIIGTALTNWTQNGSWNIGETTDFTVWDAPTGGAQSTTTLNLATPADPTIINYYIQNDGNVPITVTATFQITTGTVTSTWNPATAQVTVPVGTTRTQITLTLTDFSVGGGAFTVQFNSVKAT